MDQNNQLEKPSLYDIVLKRECSYYTGAVLIVIFAMALCMVGSTWGVSGALGTWGSMFLGLFGIDTATVFNNNTSNYSFFANQASITDIGLLLGASIACLLAAQWKIRNIKHYKQALAAIIGGLLMGVGAKMAGGCNIGGLFSQLPQFSLAAWLFLLFVFLGATVGGKLLKFFMPPVSNKRPNRKRLTAEQKLRNKRIQIIVACVLIVALLIVAFVVAPTYPKAPLLMVIGLGLGYVMQRSRFCFTAAYRDPGLTGETKLTRAVIVAFALSTIFFFGKHASQFGADLSGLSAENMPGNVINLQMCIGSFIFGIGAVLAGGCASGTFVRMGEGYVQLWICFPFFCIGNAVAGAITKATAGTWFTAGSKVYLPQLFGGLVPALLIQLLALLGLWILAWWWENKKRAQFN